jgi:hypothetical protein
MTTIADSSKYFIPMMSNNRNRWSKSKQLHYMNNKNFRKREHFPFSKVFKRKEQLIKFPSFSLLGGNRRDPLNLNELIQKKKQSTTNNEHIEVDIYGNDRPIEILLQPNIFDPLRLDISSYNNENSISFNSINQETYIQKPQRHFRSIQSNWFYDQQVPEQK